MSELTVEQMIQDKGLDAPRITPNRISELMDRVTYVGHVLEGTTSTFVHAYLDKTFFLATGHSACVSPENFDPVIGEKIAARNAAQAAQDKLWELEGYRLYSELSADSA